MKKYVLIAIGGFLGAILRMMIKSVQLNEFISNFPIQTLMINITGSFLLALVSTTALRYKKFDPDIKLAITTGFLGAFTTFSTLCKETIKLLENGSYILALLYPTISILFGLAAAYLGGVFLWKKNLPDRNSNKGMISKESKAGGNKIFK